MLYKADTVQFLGKETDSFKNASNRMDKAKISVNLDG